MSEVSHARSTKYPVADISNRIASLHRDYFGKGPNQVKTYVEENLILSVLGEGETTVEQALRASGRINDARRARTDLLQATLGHIFRETIQELTGQPVYAFAAGHSDESDVTVLVFLLEAQL